MTNTRAQRTKDRETLKKSTDKHTNDRSHEHNRRSTKGEDSPNKIPKQRPPEQDLHKILSPKMPREQARSRNCGEASTEYHDHGGKASVRVEE